MPTKIIRNNDKFTSKDIYKKDKKSLQLFNILPFLRD